MSTLTSRPTVLVLAVVHKQHEGDWAEYEGDLTIGAEEVPPDVLTCGGETYVRYAFTTPMEHKPKYTYTAHYRPASVAELAAAGRLRQ